MPSSEWIKQIEGIDGLDVKRGAMLKDYTTVRIGGECTALVEARDYGALITCMKVLGGENMPPVDVFVLGGGSNLLVGDRGYDGFVIKLGGGFKELVDHDGSLTVGAGCLMRDLSLVGVREGWGGTEHFAGLPGTVGGAVRMNAGAWGREIWDDINWVYAVDMGGGEHVISREEARPSYRNGGVPTDFIITRVEIRYEKESPALLKQRLRQFLVRRKSVHAISLPTFGSVFKNPKGFHAGKLIDTVGLRGKRIGGAMISEKHANFIVNTGGARAVEVLSLMRLMKEGVYGRFGIELEPEVIFLGLTEEELEGIL
jgi:UDP-N-acetylmuramate dehydrogenase